MIARVTESGMEPLTNSLIGNSPIGTIVSYAGTSIPAGYLLCNGSTFESDTYPELTALLGGTTTPSITDTTPLGYKIIKALMITGGSVGSVADVVTVPNIEIGTVFAFAGTVCPEHYLPCDGSEFDTTTYSELYNILGSNKLPDYREVVLVGAGTNTTDSIETHDTYTVGQFKDDQLQEHTHTYPIGASVNITTSGNTYVRLSNSQNTETTNSNSGRKGTTTHGKQKGVLYIIKADREDMTDLVTKVDEYLDSRPVWRFSESRSSVSGWTTVKTITLPKGLWLVSTTTWAYVSTINVSVKQTVTNAVWRSGEGTDGVTSMAGGDNSGGANLTQVIMSDGTTKVEVAGSLSKGTGLNPTGMTVGGYVVKLSESYNVIAME